VNNKKPKYVYNTAAAAACHQSLMKNAFPIDGIVSSFSLSLPLLSCATTRSFIVAQYSNSSQQQHSAKLGKRRRRRWLTRAAYCWLRNKAIHD